MKIPNELVEQFSRGNGAVFVGAGLSIGAGLPGWGNLIQRLKGELEDCPEDAAYPDIAQYYVIRHGKNRLITRLREELDTYDIVPTSVHNALVKLEISPLFTTNYDNLIEKALQAAGIRFDSVVSTVDASFWTSDRIQLVKFHGDINQPSTVVLTSEDYECYYPKHPALTRLLSITLQTRTLLLLGYSATDIDFRLLLTQVQSESGAYARNAYAVMFDAPALVTQDMDRRGIKVINFVDIPLEDRNETLSAWLAKLGNKIDDKEQVNIKETPKKNLPQEPYKFLNWFGEEDIAIFHGRDYEINRLANLVETQQITILYGESGTGKTSLLRAGVAPMLRDKGYYVAYFRPLADPFKEAEEVLKFTFGVSQDASNTIREIITEKLSKEKTLLIILDQFEEFFIRQGVNTRKKFEKTLKDILDIPDRYVHIVFSLRSDYLDRLDEFEDILVHDPLRFRMRLHNLGSASASAAIWEPAKDFGINLSQSLLEKLVTDLGQGLIAPPQLQIVCYSLWKDWSNQGKPSSGLTLERYFDLGSTEEILANYLTRVIEELSDESVLSQLSITLKSEAAQNTAKAILKCLITSEKTKIAANSKEITQSELVQKLNLPFDQIKEILRYLQNHRIVRHIPDSQYYELVHEVMISQIWGWVTEDERRILDIQDILQRAITDYHRFQTLLSSDYLSLVSENINNLIFSNDQLELLLTSAINYNYVPNIWVERMNAEHAIEVLEKLLATGKKVLYPQIASALGFTKSPKAVRYLDDLCREENRETQRSAAKAMASLNFRSVIPPLFHALMREEHMQRSAPFLEALEMFQNEEATAMLILAAMEHKDTGVRKRATNAVIRSKNSDRFKLLAMQLGTDDTLIRTTAIDVLQTIIEEKPLDAIGFYRESNVEVRIAIIRGLTNGESKSLLELLRLSLTDTESSVRREAVITLGRLNSKPANELLLVATKDSDPQLRCLAITLLSKTGAEHLFDIIFAAFEDENVDVRIVAASILGEIKNEKATDALITQLMDLDQKVQQHIISLLSQRKDNYTYESLTNALTNKNIQVSQKAAIALDQLIVVRNVDNLFDSFKEGASEARMQAARLNAVEAIEPLIGALKNDDPITRRRVTKVLGELKDRRAVASLINALKDTDPEVRRQAAIALGRLKDKRALHPLTLTLKDDIPEVRSQAAVALRQLKEKTLIIPQSVDDLITNLRDNNPEVRWNAALKLGRLKDKRAVGPLIDALKDEDSDVRRQAAIALKEMKSVEAVKPLIDALKDDDLEVRRQAAIALREMKAVEAVKPLIDALKDDDLEVRRRAAIALREMKAVEAVKPLIDALRDEGSAVRWQAAIALREMKAVEAVKPLIDALKDDDPEVRRQAAIGLGELKSVEAVKLLIDALKNEVSDVRLQAAIALGEMKAVEAVEPLIDTLRDEIPDVRWQAAIALSRLKDKRATDTLLIALQDGTAGVRRIAVIALGQINALQSVDGLIDSLSDQDSAVRWLAAKALGQLKDKRAVNSLIHALGDNSPEVQRQASIALTKLRGT